MSERMNNVSRDSNERQVVEADSTMMELGGDGPGLHSPRQLIDEMSADEVNEILNGARFEVLNLPGGVEAEAVLDGDQQGQAHPLSAFSR
ncbi:hypothetical protein AAVH_27930 [Aphelenchoides avenae]|nr:hypothetical protein AAVH_27930 [Aphelenchus avenae]